MNSPERGEVWLVDLGLTAKVRPALVLSVAIEESDRALVTLVPHRQPRVMVAQVTTLSFEAREQLIEAVVGILRGGNTLEDGEA